MAYDSPKAAHIRAEVGGFPMKDSNDTRQLRWGVAEYLQSQGITNLMSEPQRRKARDILNHVSHHPELLKLSRMGLIEFYLDL